MDIEYQMKNKGTLNKRIHENFILNQNFVAEFLTDIFEYMKNLDNINWDLLSTNKNIKEISKQIKLLKPKNLIITDHNKYLKFLKKNVARCGLNQLIPSSKSENVRPIVSDSKYTASPGGISKPSPKFISDLLPCSSILNISYVLENFGFISIKNSLCSPKFSIDIKA